MDAANQLQIFLVCAAAGIAGGVIYDVFFVLRKCARDNSAVTAVADVLFFLSFAGLCIFLKTKFSFPDLRVYMYLGNALGFLIYLKSVHRIVAFWWKVCYNKLIKGLKRRKIPKSSKKKEEIGV